MRVGIHQPNLLPRLPVVSKLACCDVTISFDTVQFSKGDWQNRCMLAALWDRRSTTMATLAVKTAGKGRQRIADVELCDSRYSVARVRTLLRSLYGRSPYFSEIERLSTSLVTNSTRLTDITVPGVSDALQAVGRPSPIELIGVGVGNGATTPTERIIALCQWLGATEYLCGSGALSYIDCSAFKAARIGLVVHRWKPVLDMNVDHRLSYIDFVARHGGEALIQETREHGSASLLPA